MSAKEETVRVRRRWDSLRDTILDPEIQTRSRANTQWQDLYRVIFYDNDVAHTGSSATETPDHELNREMYSLSLTEALDTREESNIPPQSPDSKNRLQRNISAHITYDAETKRSQVEDIIIQSNIGSSQLNFRSNDYNEGVQTVEQVRPLTVMWGNRKEVEELDASILNALTLYNVDGNRYFKRDYTEFRSVAHYYLNLHHRLDEENIDLLSSLSDRLGNNHPLLLDMVKLVNTKEVVAEDPGILNTSLDTSDYSIEIINKNEGLLDIESVGNVQEEEKWDLEAKKARASHKVLVPGFIQFSEEMRALSELDRSNRNIFHTKIDSDDILMSHAQNQDKELPTITDQESLTINESYVRNIEDYQNTAIHLAYPEEYFQQNQNLQQQSISRHAIHDEAQDATEHRRKKSFFCFCFT